MVPHMSGHPNNNPSANNAIKSPFSKTSTHSNPTITTPRSSRITQPNTTSGNAIMAIPIIGKAGAVKYAVHLRQAKLNDSRKPTCC